MGVGRAFVATWIAAGSAGVLSMASRSEIVMKMIGATYPLRSTGRSAGVSCHAYSNALIKPSPPGARDRRGRHIRHSYVESNPTFVRLDQTFAMASAVPIGVWCKASPMLGRPFAQG